MKSSRPTTRLIRSLRNGQITIPADFRRRLGIAADTLVEISLDEGELRVKPVWISGAPRGSHWLKELYDQFAPVRQEAEQYSEREINAAIDQAVKAVRRRHA